MRSSLAPAARRFAFAPAAIHGLLLLLTCVGSAVEVADAVGTCAADSACSKQASSSPILKLAPHSVPPNMPKAPGASPPQPLFREQRLGASDSLDGLYLPGIPASLPVTVVPPVLHFGSECPLCIPSIGTAELINLSEDEDLEVHSISSQSEHFHAPLSELQRLPPGGRMNISIVFLPRAKGSVNTTLLIQTSAGGFFYPVHGGGGPNPYSVHPLLPSAVLHGSAYEPLISIRNPHGTPMQIKEVLSSEPFVHLMLPPAEIQHGAVTLRELWTVAPGETKAVLALRIDSTDATALSNATALTSGAEGGPIEVGVYRAYVHVKTDFDTLIIPVQVPVLREGVFAVMPGGTSPIGELNFGTLTNPDSVVTLPISLLSNIDAPRLKVLDVRALRHHSSMHVQLSRKIEGTSPMLNPLEEREIVLVSFSGKVPGNFSGKLRVRFEHPDPRWATSSCHGVRACCTARSPGVSCSSPTRAQAPAATRATRRSRSQITSRCRSSCSGPMSTTLW